MIMCFKTNPMRYTVILLVVMVLTSACNPAKKAKVHETVVVVPPSRDTVLIEHEPEKVNRSDSAQIRSLVEGINMDFQSALLTGSMVFENTTDRYNFNFNIRMVKDSVIWMQLKKIGLEGARMLIRRDSLFLVDRIHRTYLKKSWNEIRTQLNGPVDFDALYSILTGNVEYFDKGMDTLKTSENMKWIYSSDGNNRTVIGINAVFNTLVSYMVQDLRKDNLIRIGLANHKILYDKKYFSYLRDLEIFSNNAKLLYINFSFDEVRRNAVFNLPFEIPSSYKPMEM